MKKSSDPMPSTNPSTRLSRGQWLALLGLFVAGLLLRTLKLGDSSLQIDNFMFWDLLGRDVGPIRIVREWIELVSLTGQLPFPAAFAKAFLSAIGLPLSFATMILPFALLGALAVPAAYGAGREMLGHRFGLLFGGLVAASPMAIQLSREAYFYAPAFLGAMLALWAALIAGRLLRRQAVPRHFHAVNAAGLFLMTHSTPSTWPYAAFYATYLLALFGWAFFRRKQGGLHFTVLMATLAPIVLPLLIAPWGLKQIADFTSDGETRSYWTEVFAMGRAHPSLAKLWPILCAYAWGSTWPRQLFSGLVLVAGCAYAATQRRRQPAFAIMGIITAAALALNIVAIQKSVWIFGITRVVPLVPFYLLLLAAGLYFALLKAAAVRRWQFAATLPIVLAGILWVEPAYLAVTLQGKLRPYQAIADWADEHLPADTPILTDRYFTAFNEFRVHAPRKVHFTSASPNQIPEHYHGTQFRARVLDFLDRNPGAALFEEKHLWDHPKVGPWTDIHARFARREQITDSRAYRLSQLGMNYRMSLPAVDSPDAYSGVILYNLPEDIAEKMRAKGQTIYALFGAGWKSVGTQDYHLWRIMLDEAEIELWNLEDQPREVRVALRGVAPNTPRSLVASHGDTAIFPANQIHTWTSRPLMLQPGVRRIQLRELSGSAQAPLLAATVAVQPVPPPAK